MESIEFSITLSAQYTEQSGVPTIEVFLDDECIVGLTAINKQKTITFTLDLDKDISHKLCLKRTGHNEINEQSVTIENFQVDDINLNKLLDKIYFYPKYPALWHKQQIESGNEWPAKQKGWRSFGFNGQWIMEFDTPFYTWLLSNT